LFQPSTIMPRRTLHALLALVACFAYLSHARAQSDRVDVVFSTNQQTQFGQSIYVLGNLPELGAGDVRRAVKLEPSQYPVWRASISLPANTTYTYQFVRRTDDAASVGNAANATLLGSLIQASTPTVNLQPERKALVYHSGWARPIVSWRIVGAASFTRTASIDIGQGRGPTERRWLALLPVAPRARIEWFIEPSSDTPTTQRDPSAGTYTCALDAFVLQDGQIFAYHPPATVSPPRRDYNASAIPFINSTNLNNERRQYRVWLPRGYTQNTTKRYPVLFMHDGQNIFEPGSFGTWNADSAAHLQMVRGEMREVIIVGADSTSNRFIDYVPPGDLTPSVQQGQADRYIRFLTSELRPLINTTYRTLTDASVTGTMGSSMGGQVSMVMGWDWTNTYTRIGALSNYWSTNFRNRIMSNTKPSVKLYMDSGNAGTASDNFSPTFTTRDNFNNPTRAGGPFVLERDFRHTIGIGAEHNEAAWAARVGPALSFLYPASEEQTLLSLASLQAFEASADGMLTPNDAYLASAMPFDANRNDTITQDDPRAVAHLSRRTERSALLHAFR
jgi:predicted alpha/beta superfamily hydrolase